MMKTTSENKMEITADKNQEKKKVEKGQDRLQGNSIVRSIQGNMLVIDCNDMNYKLRMLESNKIPGLLPLEIIESDGIKKLCYDITSREAFGSLGTVRTLKMEDVRNLLYSLKRILGNLEKYLLDTNDLILDKNYIYVKNTDLDPRLCYLPGYDTDFAAGLSTLLQDVLGMVDHNDHDAVVLAYSLYQESLKPGYVMDDLLRILYNDNYVKNEGSRYEDRTTEEDSTSNQGMGPNKSNGNNPNNPNNPNNANSTSGVNNFNAANSHTNYNNPNSASTVNGSNNPNRELTTDELFIQYQMPASKKDSKAASDNQDTLFAMVNKVNRRKHATIFSR